MDNTTVADRYRFQAEARLDKAGLLASNDPSFQFDDADRQHATRADIGMLLWSAAVDLASALFIQETRTQPNGRSPQINRFITEELANIKPGVLYNNRWRFVVKLHTAQHSTNTDPATFSQDCIDSALMFEVLNWLLQPTNRISLESYGWLRRIRTERILFRDDSLETVASYSGLQEYMLLTSTDSFSFPIHRAAQNPNPNVIAHLIANGHNVDLADPENESPPLHWAASGGSPQVIEVLLRNHADLGATDPQGATPLHKAARSNSADTVATLVEHGANVNARDARGETPLHWSATWQQDPMVTEILLNNGANPDQPSLDGQTARSLVNQSNPILTSTIAQF